MGSLTAWPLTSRDAKEHPVPALQFLLCARGHPVVVDGIFGPRTGEAVRTFQRSRNLAADGIAGPLTWRALVMTLRRGDAGDAVRAVQEEFHFRSLCRCGRERDTVDGIFGPRTDEAVRRFQTAVREDVPAMAVDGIVGPMTWQALVSGMCSY